MKTFIKVSALLVSLLFLTACMESSGPRGGVPQEINQNEIIESNGSNIQGHYAADIWPVNYNLHFKKLGTVAISRDQDSFTTNILFQYGPKGARIKQALYTGRRCPNLNDDLNQDAYIDILEARLAIGKITIPFDSDLSTQDSGHGIYPVVNFEGKMSYTQSVSFSRMFEDLKAPDNNPEDQIIKLKEEEGLTLPGRIVLFQGVPDSITLPESVATTDGDRAHESLPSACAVLWKVEALPSEIVRLPQE